MIAAERRFDNPQLPDPQIYSHAVSVDNPGRLVFIAGQLGQRKDGSYPEALQDEVAQSFKNLVDVLRVDGADVSDLVKLTLYVVNWSHEGATEFFSPLLSALLSQNGVQSRPTTTLVPVTQLADPRARFEVDGIAAIPQKVKIWSTVPAASPRDAAPTQTDVIVVGAGFSGLQAAVDIHNARLQCIVLEANDRIGGRSYTSQLAGHNGNIELGATWINKTTQPKAYALTQEFGLECVDQYSEGDNVWQGMDGVVRRLGHNDLPAPTSDKDTIAQLFEKLDAYQKGVDLVKTTSQDEDMSVEDWIQKATTNAWGRDLMRHSIRGLVGGEARDVSMHYIADYIKSGGGIMPLLSEGPWGAQSLKVKQGTSSIAGGLAVKLHSGSIIVNSPVISIVQDDQGCLVTTSTGRQFRAARVIMANPTNTYDEISFAPALPFAKRQILSRTMPGRYAKTIVTYKQPWWKSLGMSGIFSSMKGPILFSWEMSDEVNKKYHLALFVAGDRAVEWGALKKTEREQALLTNLVELVGQEHADVVTDVLEFNEKIWTDADYFGGAPTSSMRVGDLGKYGQVLRAPFGKVHFAGGELAYEWKGYLEGALLSGSRAAAEVVKALKQK